MLPLTQSARALVDPLDGIRPAVASRRFLWPLLFLVAAMSFSGVAFALRWDAASAVFSKLATDGELERKSERELEEAVTQAWRVKLVGKVAGGIFFPPLLALLLAVAVKVGCWLLNRPIRFAAAFSAVALALLPLAVFHLAAGTVALASAGLSEAQGAKLIPSHLGDLLPGLPPARARLAGVVDLFNLWAAMMLGLGISAGTGMGRGRGVLFGLLLYAAFAGVFLIGLPAMGGGG